MPEHGYELHVAQCHVASVDQSSISFVLSLIYQPLSIDLNLTFSTSRRDSGNLPLLAFCGPTEFLADKGLRMQICPCGKAGCCEASKGWLLRGTHVSTRASLSFAQVLFCKVLSFFGNPAMAILHKMARASPGGHGNPDTSYVVIKFPEVVLSSPEHHYMASVAFPRFEGPWPRAGVHGVPPGLLPIARVARLKVKVAEDALPIFTC